MENIIIRNAADEDYNAVEEIMQECHSLHVKLRPDIYKNTKTVFTKEYFSELLSESRLIIAEKNGIPAALLSFGYKHIQSDKQVERKIIFIENLAVKLEFRLSGLGSALLAFAAEKAKKEGCVLELQVNAENKTARKVYEKFGFTEKSINMELL